MKSKKLTRLIILVLSILVLLYFNSCKPKGETNRYLGVDVKQIETELNTLLNCYYPKNLDTINGGFYTNYDSAWNLMPNQEKMVVTQARYLWTASKALSIYPENKIYRQAADHGFQFLTNKMWDKINGGFYFFANSDSILKQQYKFIYGNAFVLYALSEYAKINKSLEVLEWVNKTFQWMEENSHDSIFKGYYSIVLHKNLKVSETKKNEIIERIGLGGPLGKDQNTSIHILEALTNAYQVLKSEKVKQRLYEMLSLVRDTMVAGDGYLKLYFNRTWVPVSNRDSSEEYIRKNIDADHISFGHNIETAYLIIDASEALYGKVDSSSLKVAKKMIDHTLSNGFDTNYYGLLDKGYLFNGKSKIEVMDSTKVWWAQAEALNALALISFYYPDESKYKEAFYDMWQYVQKELIDHKNGGWYDSGIDKSPEAKKAPKAQMWKGNYHDGRALMLLLDYSKPGRQTE